jgi:biopolymer transport protein ExbD
MAIEVGHGSSGTMVSVNVVPLIDILLVLIIIFMVITPMTPRGLEAMIPQPAPPNQRAQQEISQKTIVVQVLQAGRLNDSGLAQNVTLKINGEDATWGSLGPRLTDVFKTRADKIAFIKGDDKVRFSDIARAIDIMRSSGIDKVGLITASLESGR